MAFKLIKCSWNGSLDYNVCVGETQIWQSIVNNLCNVACVTCALVMCRPNSRTWLIRSYDTCCIHLMRKVSRNFRSRFLKFMQTTWHENAFRMTGSLWEESNVHRWIPLRKGLSWRALVSFRMMLVGIDCWRSCGGLVIWDAWVHFYWHGLTYITTWISNYIH